MSMYFQDLRSNSAMMAMPSATQPKPARKPAAAPQEVVVFASARNMARLADITTEKTKAKPKTLPIFRFPSCSVVKLLSAIQTRPKMAGEYQSLPSANADNAAATTANQFTFCVGMLFLRSNDLASLFFLGQQVLEVTAQMGNRRVVVSHVAMRPRLHDRSLHRGQDEGREAVQIDV